MKKIFNFENLVYLTIILLPAYAAKLNIFGISSNVLEMLIFLIFILWFLANRKKFFEDVSRSVFSVKNRKLSFSILIIFFGLSLSTLANKNYAAGLGIIKGWFIFPLLLVFLISQIFKRDKIVNVFGALYVSSFLVSLVAIGYLFSGSLTYDGRLEAFFNSPNYLAMYLAPGLLILAQVKNLKFKVQNSSLWSRSFFIISGLAILVAFYFTFSYAAWLAAISSLFITEVIRRRYFSRKMFLIVFILFIFSVFQLKTVKFNDLANYDPRSSLASRMMIWQSAGKILEDNWFLGIGPGNFQEKYLEYQKYYPPYLEWAVPHPHNLYLAFWLYGGIFGFAGFVFLLVFWLKNIIKKNDSAVNVVVLSIFLYILIHGIFDTTYFKNDLAIIFWINFLPLI